MVKKRGKKAESEAGSLSKVKIMPSPIRSQGEVMGMSFSTIFSILLIISFIVVSIIVISYIISWKNCSQIAIFTDDFKEAINNAWTTTGSSYDFKNFLPTGIKYVCFYNISQAIISSGTNELIIDELRKYAEEKNNMYFYPSKNACVKSQMKIEHLDIDKITENKNPYCIPVINGKITIQIDKGFNEKFVRVSY
jgi:hypothetical protein